MRSAAVIAVLGTVAGLGVLVAAANAQNAQHLPIVIDDRSVAPDKRAPGKPSKKPSTPKVDNTPKGFARRLRLYLEKTRSFGSRAKPDPNVKSAQRGMGGGLVVDGIVGPKTRKRAAALGSVLPDAPKLESYAVTVGPATIHPPHALPLPPPNPPAPTPAKPAAKEVDKTDNTPKGFAARLRAYLEKTRSFGSRAKPDANVKKAQKGMGGGLAVDGVVGIKTRQRAAALGSVLPDQPAPNVKPPPAPKPAPKPAAAAPAPKPKALPAPKPKGRSATQAAEALYSYATARIRGDRVDELGTKSSPSEFVRDAQADMKGLQTDGIYGPKTQARGKELTGKPWPTRPPPKKATAVHARTATQAASELLSYLEDGGLMGTRAAPAPTVRDAQHDMGGGLVADGIYGPKTQARGKALTGKPFPTRT